MKDTGYVVRNSTGLYFIGMNQVSDQLRKAKIYHSIRYAEESMNDLNNAQRKFNMPSKTPRDFKIIKVEISEID